MDTTALLRTKGIKLIQQIKACEARRWDKQREKEIELFNCTINLNAMARAKVLFLLISLYWRYVNIGIRW